MTHFHRGVIGQDRIQVYSLGAGQYGSNHLLYQENGDWSELQKNDFSLRGEYPTDTKLDKRHPSYSFHVKISTILNHAGTRR